MTEQRDLSGIVQPGLGRGTGLMADRVVMEKLQQLAGFAVVPGTLNVRLPRPLGRGPSWRYMPAAEITPDWEARTGQAGYFGNRAIQLGGEIFTVKATGEKHESDWAWVFDVEDGRITRILAIQDLSGVADEIAGALAKAQREASAEAAA